MLTFINVITWLMHVGWFCGEKSMVIISGPTGICQYLSLVLGLCDFLCTMLQAHMSCSATWLSFSNEGECWKGTNPVLVFLASSKFLYRDRDFKLKCFLTRSNVDTRLSFLILLWTRQFDAALRCAESETHTSRKIPDRMGKHNIFFFAIIQYTVPILGHVCGSFFQHLHADASKMKTLPQSLLGARGWFFACLQGFQIFLVSTWML